MRSSDDDTQVETAEQRHRPHRIWRRCAILMPVAQNTSSLFEQFLAEHQYEGGKRWLLA